MGRKTKKMRGGGGCFRGICSTNAGRVAPLSATRPLQPTSATRPLQPTVVPTSANNEIKYVTIYKSEPQWSADDRYMGEKWSSKEMPIEVVRGTIIEPLGTPPTQDEIDNNNDYSGFKLVIKELNIGDIVASYSDTYDAPEGKWDFFKLIGKRETEDPHPGNPVWTFKRVNYDGTNRENESYLTVGHSKIFNNKMTAYKIILPESMRITNSGERDTISHNIRSSPPAGTNRIDGTNVLQPNASVSPPSAGTNRIDDTNVLLEQNASVSPPSVSSPSEVTTIPGTPLSSSSTSSTHSQVRQPTILRTLPPGFRSGGGKRRKRTNKKSKKTKRKTHRR